MRQRKPDNDKGIIRGMRVRVKKGAVIQSTNPAHKEGTRTAGRTYTVTVFNTLPARRIRVGTRFPGADEPSYHGHTDSDLYRCAKILGIDTSGKTSDQIAEAVYALAVEEDGDWPTRTPDGKGGTKPYTGEPGKDLWVTLRGPTITWVGSGGYWQDCSVDDVELITDP